MKSLRWANISRVLSLFLLVFLLASCTASAGNQPSAASPAVTGTPTPTSTASATATHTPILPTVTSTATFTPSPTVALPVHNGEDIPDVALQPITAENAERLVELASYGPPNADPAFITANKKFIVSATRDDITVTNASSKKAVRTLESNSLNRFPNIYFNGTENRFAAVTPDGLYFLKPGLPGVIELWSSDGKLLFTTSVGETFSADISPNSRLIALGESVCASACRVKIIDWRKGESIQTLDGSIPMFSPGGQYLAIRQQKEVVVYNTKDWQPVFRMAQPQPDAIRASQQLFSPNNELIAEIEQKVIKIWRISDQSLVRDISNFESAPDPDSLPEVTFSENGAWLLIEPASKSDPATLKIVSIETGEIKTTEVTQQADTVYWPTQDGALDNFTVEPLKAYPWYSWAGDYFIYSGAEITLFGEDMQIWHKRGSSPTYLGNMLCKKGECVRHPYPERVVRSYLTQSGTYYTLQTNEASLDLFKGEAKIASFPKNKHYAIEAAGDQNVLLRVGDEWNPKIYSISSTTGETLNTWLKPVREPYIDGNWVSFVQYVLEGYRSYMNKYHVIVYDAESKSVLYDQQRSPSFVLTNAENHQLFMIADGYITHKIIDGSDTPEETVYYESNRQNATCAAISSDGELIAIGATEGQIMLYDTVTRKVIKYWQGHSSTVFTIAFSPDKTRIATYGFDGYVRVWGVRGDGNPNP